MFKSSSKDHGIYVVCLISCHQSKDVNACTDVLFTVLKVAAARKELGIEPNSPLPETLPDFRRMAARKRYSFIMKLSTQFLKRCEVVEEALIGATVQRMVYKIMHTYFATTQHWHLNLQMHGQWELDHEFASVGNL